jgi:hypothetical protein
MAWAQVLTYLPPDLERSARTYGALRRVRQIPSAAVLLRLLLAYANGVSLDTLAARATELGLVEHLSDNALHERFERMVPWVSFLLGQQLAGHQATFPWGVHLRIKLVDASGLCRPGATGTDWRLHLGLNLQTGLIDHLSVTGPNIGEHLADVPLDPGDLVLGDRGYATRQGLAAVAAREAYSLVRLNWQNVPLQHRDGTPFDLWAALRTLAPGAQGAWPVQTKAAPDAAAVVGRLIVQALPPEAAATARRKVHQAARKKGKTPTAETLAAAGYVLLFTSLPDDVLTPAQPLALYRLRWQIEIVFKRDKSALRLDDIRATTDAVCYAVLLAKCLLLLLLERLAWATGLFSPSGDAAGAGESLSVAAEPRGDAHRDPAAAADPDEMADLAAGAAAAGLYRPAPAPTDCPT